LDARAEESFRAIFTGRSRNFSELVGSQLRNNIPVHLRPFAIDRALKLQTRAMVRRELCRNHLTVIRGIVPSLGVFFDKRKQLLSTLVQYVLLGQVPEKRAECITKFGFCDVEDRTEEALAQALQTGRELE
jgi:hypothetical protein